MELFPNFPPDIYDEPLFSINLWESLIYEYEINLTSKHKYWLSNFLHITPKTYSVRQIRRIFVQELASFFSRAKSAPGLKLLNRIIGRVRVFISAEMNYK